MLWKVVGGANQVEFKEDIFANECQRTDAFEKTLEESLGQQGDQTSQS